LASVCAIECSVERWLREGGNGRANLRQDSAPAEQQSPAEKRGIVDCDLACRR